MAGLYDDAPAPRLAYDIDGTLGISVNITATSSTAVSGANMTAMNDEGGGGFSWTNTASQSMRGVFIFPQLRDLVGYFVATNGNIGTLGVLEYSNDTTNGLDGTWTTIVSPWVQSSNFGVTDKIQARNNINSITANGVKAIGFRFVSASGVNDRLFRSLHLYGRITDLETPDRLRIWHPTLDEPLDDNTTADGAHLDWAEVTQGTTADKTFRIKNNSSTLTANSIDITTSVATDASPAIGSQITYSDGGAFATSLNIGNLSPGGLSSVITVRRTTSSSAALSLWWWRTIAEASSWT